MEEYMTQQPQETSADVEVELETGSQAFDAQPEEQETEEAAPVPADENQETIEVEFSVEGVGEAEAQEEDAEPEIEQETPTIESVIEAVLFASDEPLTDSRLASIVETTAKQVRECIDALNEKYRENHNAFRIEPIAGGYQMLTISIYNDWLKKMLRARSDSKLSPAAMETLAIVAYKQPVIRADIEAIRGVAVGEVIRSLMYKGLVKIVGRAEILGRPMLYGTTRRFLEVFGLNSLKDLPKAEELKKPD
jgi:segregation and condensation protein B